MLRVIKLKSERIRITNCYRVDSKIYSNAHQKRNIVSKIMNHVGDKTENFKESKDLINLKENLTPLKFYNTITVES